MSWFDELGSAPPVKETGFAEPAIRRLAEQSQLDFELGFYHAILQRAPRYVDALRVQAEVLSRKGLYQESLQVELRLVQLRPEDCVARYNLACSLALLGRCDEAVTELIVAVGYGYDDWLHLEADHDLDNLRDHPQFVKFLAELAPR